MSELLLPCPFCGGPPVVVVTGASDPRHELAAGEINVEDGTDADGHVSCHECGTQGPHISATLYCLSDYTFMRQVAVRKWQDRDHRNADCYQAGIPEGLNLYPRPDGS